MVAKVEKSCKIDTWLNPKYLYNGSSATKFLNDIRRMENAQRLSPCGRVGASAPKNPTSCYS